MTYIKRTQTPTLVLVGERDGEAPPSQPFQFWHALRELHVPTQLVVYRDEGHAFTREDDRVDVTIRTLAWFRQYMAGKAPQSHAPSAWGYAGRATNQMSLLLICRVGVLYSGMS